MQDVQEDISQEVTHQKQILSQVFQCKQSKKSSSKKWNNTNQPAHKKSPKSYSRIDSSPMALARANYPNQPNILDGQMLEVTYDHGTMHICVANKSIPAHFVDNSLFFSIDQDLACPCCFKKTSLFGLNVHTHSFYLYCLKTDHLQQYGNYTGKNKAYMRTATRRKIFL
jgi:hypothetical protein